jgi:endogenous inhibitor of DNA gyrase (YacG/DUF329 family)
VTDETKTPAGRPCPICGKPAEPRWAPFCSKRCADVDLHRWLGGQYRIETGEPPDGDGEGTGSNSGEPRE